jgi:hypothetical protein
VGGLALGDQWYEVTLAVIMCVIGVLYLGSACACSEYAADEQAKRANAVEEAKANGTTYAKEGGSSSSSSSARYNEMEAGDSRRAKLIENPFGPSDADSQGEYVPPNTASKGAYGADQSGQNPFASARPKGSAYS